MPLRKVTMQVFETPGVDPILKECALNTDEIVSVIPCVGVGKGPHLSVEMKNKSKYILIGEVKDLFPEPPKEVRKSY